MTLRFIFPSGAGFQAFLAKPEERSAEQQARIAYAEGLNMGEESKAAGLADAQPELERIAALARKS